MRFIRVLDKGIMKYIKENKRIILIALFALVGVFFVIISTSFGGNESAEPEVSLDEYKELLEAEIESLCSDVDGVGRCRVFITFERGVQDTYKGSNIIESKPPRVLGVTVVCSGGDRDVVKRSVSEMICALFDIGYNRVAVLKLNS